MAQIVIPDASPPGDIPVDLQTLRVGTAEAEFDGVPVTFARVEHVYPAGAKPGEDSDMSAIGMTKSDPPGFSITINWKGDVGSSPESSSGQAFLLISGDEETNFNHNNTFCSS